MTTKGFVLLEMEFKVKKSIVFLGLLGLPALAEATTVLQTVDVEAKTEVHVEASKKTDSLSQSASGETLGDYVENLPSVSSATYGAAVGRPVVKGMTGYRVKVVQNDLEASDLSAMSQDHAVGVSPKSSQHIELLKGPQALLYGAHSGGVVRVVDNLADGFPKKGLGGKIDASGADNNAAKNINGELSAAGEQFAITVSGVRQQSENYQDGRGNRIQESDVLNEQAQLGVTYRYQPKAQIQLYTHYLHKDYGIPTGEVDKIRIDMTRKDYGLKWTGYELNSNLDKLQFSAQTSDYLHDETENGKADGLFGQKINTFEVSADYVLSDWNGTAKLGFQDKELQVCHSHGKCGSFTKGKPGVLSQKTQGFVDNPAYGLPYSHGNPMPDTQAQTWNLALQGERAIRPTSQLSLATHIEYRSLSANSANIDQVWIYPSSLNSSYYDTQQDVAASVSAAWKQTFAKNADWQLSLSYLQRLPSIDELYWNGAHHATDSYIFGNRNLKTEQSVNIDWDIHWQTQQGDWQGNLFYYRFQDYIYQDGLYDAAGNKKVAPFHSAEVWVTEQTDAQFYGGSLGYAHRLFNVQSTPVVLSNQFDVLYAQKIDGGNLPRTAPMTWLVGLGYEPQSWSAKLNFKHVFEATELAKNEEATNGYHLLSLYADWKPKTAQGQWKVWVKGDNLMDNYAQNHLSFLKDTAPLMGRNLAAGVSWQY